MKIPGLKNLRSRLFLKILLVFSLALFITIIGLGIAQRYFFHPKRFPIMQKHMVSHAQYIINDLGTPPDTNKARELVKNLWFNIQFETPTQQWSSNKIPIDIQKLNLPVYDPDKKIYAGFSEHGFCVVIIRQNIRYLLIMRPKREGFRYVAGMFLLFIMAFTTILIIVMYFIIRWLLKPIRTLDEGVKQLSNGNIDYRMFTKRKDELGQLIDSFSNMTDQIRRMIQARDQLLLDVSHELRSPITRIKLALEFIKEKKTRKNLQDDITEVETKITELMETERLNSQHGKLKLKRTNLHQLLRDLCSDFQNQKPGVKILPFPENINLALDPERIRILFRNILDNTLQHSDPQGYPVEISLREKPDEYTIAVQDFGKGIPEKDLPFIFEPFYRVDKSRSKKTGGYGLGMSLSKKIMEAHGGTIEIISRLKVGTTVFLKFKK
jgi:signal transduction histidine kinase